MPIFWDLVRLPLLTVLKRLRKRILPVKVAQDKVIIKGDVTMGSLNNGPMKLPVEKIKVALRLWHYYQNQEFNLLGSGWININNGERPPGFAERNYWKYSRKELGDNIPDWNRDHRSGFQFAAHESPEKCLKLALNKEGVDVKFAWEFARLHHLPQLGILAFNKPELKLQITEFFTVHLRSFQKQCNVGQGVQWASPMEVAIRLVNLLVGFDLLRESLKLLKDELIQTGLEHWHFLRNNLEDKEGLGTNHYLSNLMGLVVAGFYLQHNEVRKTANWAWAAFEKELTKQFFSDGFNFEYSVYYHRLSTEIALITMLFAKKQGFPIANKSQSILQQALSHLLLLQKHDSTLPQFGDNDSGRILDLLPDGEWESGTFSPQPERCDFIHQLFEAGSLYNRFYQPLLSSISPAKITEAQFISGNKAVHKPRHYHEWELKFKEIDRDAIKVYHIREGGIVVFKSEEFYLAINIMVNPKGHRYRGHSHNDKGSFELQVHRDDLVVDPGVLSYTASLSIRNEHRKTSAHPIPFTGKEQNRILAGTLGLFHSTLDVEAKLLHLKQFSCRVGINYRGVKTIREFNIFDDHLMVKDWCNKPFRVNTNQSIKPAAGYGKLR